MEPANGCLWVNDLINQLPGKKKPDLKQAGR
jgi:hypothetical protein